MKLDDLKFPLCIAHRGVKHSFPENTLASFRAALEAKAQMIEFDVALSKDRIPVVIHDETLDRTTNGSGKVNDYTLAELKTFDAGSWFNPRFRGETIPTLDQVLNLVEKSALLNIEIKEEYHEPEDPPDAIDKQVLRLILEKDLKASVVVSSFEMRFLERLRKQDRELALAFISRHPADQSVLDQCKKLKLYSWNPWSGVLTDEQISTMHQIGVKVFTFTVNQTEEFKKLIQLGVDGVFTDNQPYFDNFLSTIL
jgi:glycerophosphoryl diester phosphodiesterase